ncbi:signal peptidase II [Jatrophihabitans telluris]|uniref:Lipoprotein signal peptidase n=1 Tax=Jatrophihabitans telluris TaxID=2038343 RepID=A0ABY4QV44_9ACTN|nr:signal peptidase II [Jatrophihabitans telluris]UQX87178.1 signal peptidase II [Jatrophihabitans telluris]
MTSPGTEPAAPAPRTARRPTKIGIFAAVAGLALAADAISKLLVVAHISATEPGIKLLGGLVYLDQARNSGAAFSVGTGATVALTAIALIVVAVILRAARRLTSTAWAVALGLVLGGALGNLVDRLFRSPGPGRGHVVDWISVFGDAGKYYPIFNLADSCIVVGGAVAVLLSVRGVDFNGGRNPIADDDDDDGDDDDSAPTPRNPTQRDPTQRDGVGESSPGPAADEPDRGPGPETSGGGTVTPGAAERTTDA